MRQIIKDKYYFIALSVLLFLMSWFVACGPSAEEQARMQNAQPVECNVRVIFSNGHVDTIHVIYQGELAINSDGNLIDDKIGCCEQKIIAKGVSYFGILNTE